MNITEPCSSGLEREASEIGARVRAQESALQAVAERSAPDLVRRGAPTMEIADSFRRLTDDQLPSSIGELRRFFREHRDVPGFDGAMGCVLRGIKGGGAVR